MRLVTLTNQDKENFIMLFFSIADSSDESSFVEKPSVDVDRLIELNLRKICKGNKDAIGEIYDLTKNGVYGYILSILKNPDDAEDIMQDTYLKICNSADMYNAQGKPMAWIFTIARNLCLMKLRRGSRQVDLPDFEWEQLEGKNHTISTEDRMVLDAAFSQISSEESQIIMMHIISGLKHREIADILDMPLATVLSKYNRALKKLKKVISI